MADVNIAQEVENRLRKQQEKKEFKDSEGRVSGSHKERVAYKVISVSNLAELEKDPIEAAKQVTKEKIWPPLDLEYEKASGVEPGAAFYKVKAREAMAAKPFDSADAREVYTRNLTELQQTLTGCRTARQVLDVLQAFIDIDRAYLGDLSNLKHYMNHVTRYVNGKPGETVLENRPSSGDLLKKMDTIYGKRFTNFCRGRSDASKEIWTKATLYNAYSAEGEAVYIQKEKDAYTRKIVGFEQEKVEVKAETDLNKLYAKFINRYVGAMGMKKCEFLAEPEKGRELLLADLDSRIKRSRNAMENVQVPAHYKAREADWSWANLKKERKLAESEGGQKINTKPPLDFIRRTGGLKINDISVKAIQKLFGFGEVEFGNSVSDKESEAHVRHFLGAISDLAEILNFNIIDINRFGGLSIAFGSRGIGGHLATYFPQRKIINISKKRGDGSIAHEWGHYFDNVVSERNQQRASNTWGSEGAIQNPALRVAFQKVMDYIYKGNPDRGTLVNVKFNAQASPRYHIYGKDLPSAIAAIQRMYPKYGRSSEAASKTVKNYYGYLAHYFKQEVIEVPMRLSTSQYYAISSQTGSKYWIEAVELFARAFESYVLRKLLAAGRENTYLVAGFKNGNENAPYPFGQEAIDLDQLLDELVLTAKKVMEIGDFVPFTTERESTHEVYEGDMLKPVDNYRDNLQIRYDKAQIRKYYEEAPYLITFEQYADNYGCGDKDIAKVMAGWKEVEVGIAPGEWDLGLPIRNALKKHRTFVLDALRDGKSVPAPVLAQYPDLAAKYPGIDQTGKEPWQIPLKVFISVARIVPTAGMPSVKLYGQVIGRGTPKSVHRELVKEALAAGKDIPAAVLADYPELTLPTPVDPVVVVPQSPVAPEGNGTPKAQSEWHTFAHSEEAYEALRDHGTRHNGAIFIRFKPAYHAGKEVEYSSLLISLFSTGLVGVTRDGQEHQFTPDMVAAIRIPGKKLSQTARITHPEFMGILKANGLDILENSETEIRGFLDKSFTFIRTDGASSELAYQNGNILRMRGTNKRQALDKLYGFALRLEAEKKEPWELTLKQYATKRFLSEAAVENIVYAEALHIPEESYRKGHRELVEKALSEGKPVPAKVAAEYGLQKEAAISSNEIAKKQNNTDREPIGSDFIAIAEAEAAARIRILKLKLKLRKKQKV